MTQEQLKNSMEIIQGAYAFAFVTNGVDGFPICRNVLNLKDWNKTISELVVITRAGSDKVVQVKKNKKGSLYFSLNEVFKTLLLKGTFRVDETQETREKYWHDSFKQYGYQGKDDKNLVVVFFKPTEGTTFINMQKDTFTINA